MCRAALGGLIAALAFGAAPAMAQTIGGPGQDDPSQDISIEGIGFAKLILEWKVNPELAGNPSFARIGALLEKNLCWSGVFNLWGGKTRFCSLRSEPGRIDLRLELFRKGKVLLVRLVDAGPEKLILYDDQLSLERRVSEPEVMTLVNRLTERITGQPGLLGSAIAFVLRQPRYAKVIVATNTHGSRLKLISANPDINLLPRWAPSGGSIVYTVLGSRGSHVFLQSLNNNSETPEGRFLTSQGTLNSGGAFSPDGKSVILTMSVNHNADLFFLDLETNRTRQLTDRSGIETQAHWAPDASRIVFVSDRTGSPQIYLLDLETDEELRVTFDSFYNADPKFSPDGQSILFTKRVNGVDQIHIMDPYGENVRAVTRGKFDSEQPEWSPDGRQIVFASNRTGDFKLYVVSTDGSNLRRLTRTGVGFEESSPSWTPRPLAR